MPIQHQSDLVRLHPAISSHFRRYTTNLGFGVKVNLYRAVEVEGLAMALDEPDLRDVPVESVMVGDSYFMTHLGRPTTACKTAAEQQDAVNTLTELVSEVRKAIDVNLPAGRQPFLLADLPDGATLNVSTGLRATDRFLSAGADAVKVEAHGSSAAQCTEAIAGRGVPTFVHLGYTPQRGTLTRHGDSAESAAELFSKARRARDTGASGLVLEMVSEPVNRALSRPCANSLPTYSIFSGSATGGGQSINVWDAVVKPPTPRRHFPPTATLDRSDFPHAYTAELIAQRLSGLLRLLIRGQYPRRPQSTMPASLRAQLEAANPWGSM